MSSASVRPAPPSSQGGLARLVSRFESLDASPKSRPGVGGAQKTRGRPPVASKIPAPSSSAEPRLKRITTTGPIPRSVTSSSLAPAKALPVKNGLLKSPVKHRRVGNAVASPSAGVAQGGSVVAQRRRLFERGLDENIAPNTYEPKRVASPAPLDDKAPSLADSPAKASSIISVGVDEALSGLHDEKDVVPDSMTPTSQVAHPEYLPPPLASSRPSSRNQEESEAGAQGKKDTSQRGSEPRIKLQGGIFLPKPPSPLKSMVVTDVGGWPSKPSDTIPEVVLSGSSSVKTNPQEASGSSPDKQEKDLNTPSEVTLCYPCHEAVLLSSASDALQALKERSGSSLATSKIPSPQSKVSNLRTKFDGTLPSSVSMPAVSKRRSQADTKQLNTKTPVRPSSAMQVSLRPGPRRDGRQIPQRLKDGTLKEKIGLWESRSQQEKRESKSRIPRTALPPKFSKAATTKRISASQGQGQGKATIRTFDGAPSPMTSSADDGSRHSSSRSPVVDSVSSQTIDVKPLPYSKPSLLKPTRQTKSFVYNVDGEGGVTLEQQPYQEMQFPGAWPDEDCNDSSPTQEGPTVVSRHPSLRFLSRRLMSRSQGLFFVSQARCTLEQPQPVRGREMRRLASLCRERMAALRGRAQTE
ncbi:uncharacterized protein TRIREDRAFT_108702 [Trichoderma reesei QM6a]|uniref:Predicted protein n=1 Tax=Hypocrea jecorina (strain QM6a) TaxID=431241 RepID=G0RMK1_HYPJQ|nr:uncharacterized protein TRIREDRAFT_108702 [Trichoderma reesei QM6a]EGR47387.1 predicted protein [Trichoderma reesei QM6a]